MPDEPDILDEGALEPAVDAPEAAEAPEAPAEAPTFGVDAIAEGLGSRFQERFLAHHEPAQALSEYGRSVEHLQSAYSRLSQGGEPTKEDLAAAEALGIELPAPPEPEEEPSSPLWGAPWAEPATYDEIVQLAQTDPLRAMGFIDKQPEGVIDPAFRQQVLQWWASPEGGADPAGMVAYEREKARVDAIEAAKTYADEQLAAFRAEFGDVRQKYEADTQAGHMAAVDLLATRAKNEIPDFAQHEKGVIQILADNVRMDDTYLPRLMALPIEQQMQHISDLTGAAAWRYRPAAEAEAQAEAEAAASVKAGAAGQRGRGAAGSTGGNPQSDLKRRHMESIERAVKAEAHL